MHNIALLGSSMGDNSFGQLKSYLTFLKQFGNVFIVPPGDSGLIPTLIGHFDLLILPGGSDVSPTRYGAIPEMETGRPDHFLEYFDTQILPQLLGKMPIFGICRGLQTINVLFGGTLSQDIFHPFSINGRDDIAHDVEPLEGGEKFGVNSLHHQAIEKLGEGLRIDLISNSPDKRIEAISCQEKMIWAVQWHPEEIHDKYSRAIIRRLIEGLA